MVEILQKMNAVFHIVAFLLIKQLLKNHLRLEKILTKKMKV